MLFVDVEVDDYFVLLQVRLGNAGVSFVRHFIFSVKCLNKPNMGIDFSSNEFRSSQTMEFVFCPIFQGATKQPEYIFLTEKQFPLKSFYARN